MFPALRFGVIFHAGADNRHLERSATRGTREGSGCGARALVPGVCLCPRLSEARLRVPAWRKLQAPCLPGRPPFLAQGGWWYVVPVGHSLQRSTCSPLGLFP